jgi:hypothetical protein
MWDWDKPISVTEKFRHDGALILCIKRNLQPRPINLLIIKRLNSQVRRGRLFEIYDRPSLRQHYRLQFSKTLENLGHFFLKKISWRNCGQYDCFAVYV